MSDDEVDEVVDASSSSSTPSPSEVKDPSNPAVLDKYKAASLIAQSCIAHLISLAIPSALPLSLCTAGDAFIDEEVKKAYSRDKKLEKGLAFPTCVSVNHVVGHYSPLSSASSTPLAAGDVVKLDVAVHIDGYIAALAHTFLVPSPSPPPPNPSLADLFAALSITHDAILRTLRPSLSSSRIADLIGRIAHAFHVHPVQGVLSHSLDRFVLDGPRVILNRTPSPPTSADDKKDDSKVDEFEFKTNDVYAIDVVLSTGEGKPKSLDDCSIYKRHTQSTYQLKMKVSRAFLSEVDRRSPVFPFTLRAFDESKAKFAIKECRQHDLVYSYPVLVEKEGEYVAQCKMVVWITERGAVKLCGLPVEATAAGKSEHKVADEEVKKLLNQSVLLPAAGGVAAGGAAAAAGAGTAADKADKAKKNAKKKAKKAAAKKAAEGAGGEAGKAAEDKEDKDDDDGGD